MDELALQTGQRFALLQIESDVAESIVVVPEMSSAPVPTASGRDQGAGSIEVAIGRAQVRVDGAVDPEVLRQLLGLIGPGR